MTVHHRYIGCEYLMIFVDVDSSVVRCLHWQCCGNMLLWLWLWGSWPWSSLALRVVALALALTLVALLTSLVRCRHTGATGRAGGGHLATIAVLHGPRRRREHRWDINWRKSSPCRVEAARDQADSCRSRRRISARACIGFVVSWLWMNETLSFLV